MNIGKKQIATFDNKVDILVPPSDYKTSHIPERGEITITRNSVEEGVYAPFSQDSNHEGMYITGHTINDGRDDYAENQLVAIDDLNYRYLVPTNNDIYTLLGNDCVQISNSNPVEGGSTYTATLTPKRGFSKVPAGRIDMIGGSETRRGVLTWEDNERVNVNIPNVSGQLSIVFNQGVACIYNLTVNKKVDGVIQDTEVLEKTCSDEINIDNLHTELHFDESGIVYKNVTKSEQEITGITTFCGNTTLDVNYNSEVTPTTHIIDTSNVNTECVNVSINPSNPYPIPNGLSRTLTFSPKSGKIIGSGQITMGDDVIDSWNENRTEEFEVSINNITDDIIVTIGCGSTPDPRYTVNLEWKIQDDPSAEPLAVKEFTEVVNTLINPESYKTYGGVDVESLGYTITSMSPSESFNLTGDTTITYYCSSRQYTITFEAGDDYVNINTLSVSVAHGKSITQGNVFTIDDPYELNAIEKTSGSANISYNPSTNEITVADVQSDVVITIYSKAEGTHTITLDSVCISSNKDLPDSVVDGGNYTVELTLDKLNYDSAIVHITGQDDITLNSATPYNLTISDIHDDVEITSECVPYVTLTLEYYKLGDESETIYKNVTHRVSPGEYCITDADKVTIDGYTYHSSSLSGDCNTFNEDDTIKLYYEAEPTCKPECKNVTNFEILYPGDDSAYLISEGYAPTVEKLIDALKKNVFIICKIDNIIRKGSAEYFGWDIILDDNVQPSPNIQIGTLIDCKCEPHSFYFYYTDDNPSIEILSGCFDMVNENHLGTEFNVYYNGAIVENPTISYDYHIDSKYYNKRYVTITAYVNVPGLDEPISVSKNMNVCPYFNVNFKTQENISITGDVEHNSYCWYPWYGSSSKFTIDATDDLTIKELYVKMGDYETSLNYIYSTYSTLIGNSTYNDQFSELIIDSSYLKTIAFNDGKGGSITVKTEDQGKTWIVTFNDIRGDVTIEPSFAACLNNQITVNFYKDDLSDGNLLNTKQYYAYNGCYLSTIADVSELCPEDYTHDSSYYIDENNNSTRTLSVSCDHSEYQILFKPICKLIVKCYNGECTEDNLIYREEYDYSSQRNSVHIPLGTPDYNNYVIDYAESDNYPPESFTISPYTMKDATLNGDDNYFDCGETVKLCLRQNDLPRSLYTYYDNIRFKAITDELNVPVLNEGENLNYPQHWMIIGDQYRYMSDGTIESIKENVQILRKNILTTIVTISSDNIPIAYRFESLSINNVEIKGDDNQQKQVNFTFTKNGNFILPSKLHVLEYDTWTPIILGQIDE